MALVNSYGKWLRKQLFAVIVLVFSLFFSTAAWAQQQCGTEYLRQFDNAPPVDPGLFRALTETRAIIRAWEAQPDVAQAISGLEDAGRDASGLEAAASLLANILMPNGQLRSLGRPDLDAYAARQAQFVREHPRAGHDYAEAILRVERLGWVNYKLKMIEAAEPVLNQIALTMSNLPSGVDALLKARQLEKIHLFVMRECGMWLPQIKFVNSAPSWLHDSGLEQFVGGRAPFKSKNIGDLLLERASRQSPDEDIKSRFMSASIAVIRGNENQLVNVISSASESELQGLWNKMFGDNAFGELKTVTLNNSFINDAVRRRQEENRRQAAIAEAEDHRRNAQARIDRINNNLPPIDSDILRVTVGNIVKVMGSTQIDANVLAPTPAFLVAAGLHPVSYSVEVSNVLCRPAEKNYKCSYNMKKNIQRGGEVWGSFGLALAQVAGSDRVQSLSYIFQWRDGELVSPEMERALGIERRRNIAEHEAVMASVRESTRASNQMACERRNTQRLIRREGGREMCQ